MQAKETHLLKLLKTATQYAIPIYQRTYSWKPEECQQLWADILRAGRDDNISAHFMGSVVYIEAGQYQVSNQSALLVIDGQQRLTTSMLLLEALARALGDDEPVDGFSAKKLRSYHLLNDLEEGERRYKLILTQTDKDSLIALLNQWHQPQEGSLRIHENFKLFESLITKHKHEIPAICKGIAKLMVVDIALTRGQDNPQLIFESMNSTGRELTQADLIRNYVLMGLEPVLQARLYELYWRPMELEFGQEAYEGHFDNFMRHYLTVKMGEIPNINKVYEAFKKHSASFTGGVEALVEDVRSYASYYCAMALAKEEDINLKLAFHDLRELKVEVAYPLLLELYQDYKSDVLSKKDILSAVRLIESYVFRRAVCAIPTNSMNKTFATFGRSLKKDRYLESVLATFLLLPSYRRFPDDDEFVRCLKSKDLYNFRIRSFWLRRLENHGRKERVPVDEYTIEHVMPQSDNDATKVPQVWREELGDDWERVWKDYRHTLGNLTLTGYNSEMSNKPFTEKRDMEGGFAQSPLRLNDFLRKQYHWGEEEIVLRAQILADKAKGIWKAPCLPADILEAYKPEPAPSQYSIEDHHQLASGPVRELFEAFRKQILALDPCVSEEFLKLYVAYKAETNFVDIVPQAKRLRLSLNMKFHEIEDTKDVCKDVSSLGRWGNGDVEVGLSDLDEIPYVMGLVRQSFEKQMGDCE